MKIYRGIFWWIDNRLVCRKVWCSQKGVPLEGADFTSKSGESFNHKAEWRLLPKEITGRKPYNYYPRGRVEIKRGRAVIYLNPVLNREEVLNKIYQEFGLEKLSYVSVKCDGSAHYQALYSNAFINKENTNKLG